MREILLLQVAAKNYNLEPEERFGAWFQDMELLNENDSYSLSCQLGPQASWPAEYSRPRRTGHHQGQGPQAPTPSPVPVANHSPILSSGDTAGTLAMHRAGSSHLMGRGALQADSWGPVKPKRAGTTPPQLPDMSTPASSHPLGRDSSYVL
ncbi:ral guanine nucleotide dissociation stimulator-like [Diceros bicornis minor]|uniref:ral guanine nucleotide dissociation stimulator-like n=1 Tax=Diceros bicornis minor TaxID=77932 RepID=UPI0026EB4CD3|nr:ral guanine nucleotide dissociation stimulator-like [Diceros bicornis minor]